MIRRLRNLSALHTSGEFDVARDLVCTGASLEDRLEGNENHTPLHLAVLFLQVDLLRLLVEAGADVNSQLDVATIQDGAPIQRILGLDEGVQGTIHVSPIYSPSKKS